jgi:hypothetical protein
LRRAVDFLRRVPLVLRRAVDFLRRVPLVLRRAVLFRRVADVFRRVVFFRVADVLRRVVFFRVAVFLRRVPVVFFRPRVVLRAELARDRLRLVDAALRVEDFFRAVERFRVDFLRADAVDFFAVLLRRLVLLRRVLFRRAVDVERLLAGASCSLGSESSSLFNNFFATPTAAGTATPSAAPAAIFFGVERPSSSPFDMTSSSSATVLPPLSGNVNC